MKRLWSSLACAFVIAIGFQQAASSQGMNPIGATEFTQLANKLLLIKQLANQAIEIKNQVKQLENMLLNTTGFSTQLWGTAMQDLDQLNNLLSQSTALAYTASNLDAAFAAKYSTYSSYLSQNMGANAWKQKYTQWSQDSSNNALYALKALGLQNQQMQKDEALLQQLQTMAGSADGRMQALQVANMVAAQNVDQIQKLRQLMMLQVQMQANYLATQQDKEAAHEANRENLFRTWKDTPDNDGKVY